MTWRTQLISAVDRVSWKKVLSLYQKFDTYHLPEYHLLAQKNGEGNPYLFHFEYHDYHASIPFLVRNLSALPGLEHLKYCDVTSVYGYPGVLSSLPSEHPYANEFRARFQKDFYQCLKDMHVIAFFTRQNPFFATSWLFETAADIIKLGQTVAIDLALSEDQHKKIMRRRHTEHLRQSQRNGVEVFEDSKFEYFENFIHLYHETMRSKGADEYYMFSHEYFTYLREILGEHVKLFVVKKENDLLTICLAFTASDIIQYYLCGTPRIFLKYSPQIVVIDKLRQWGKEQGYKWLHLGGGLGSREDSLFFFKAGFSKLHFPFEIIKSVLDPQAYDEASDNFKTWLKKNNLMITDKNFFPIYRAKYAERISNPHNLELVEV